MTNVSKTHPLIPGIDTALLGVMEPHYAYLFIPHSRNKLDHFIITNIFVYLSGKVQLILSFR
jgi:hypothetical protein